MVSIEPCFPGQAVFTVVSQRSLGTSVMPYIQHIGSHADIFHIHIAHLFFLCPLRHQMGCGSYLMFAGLCLNPHNAFDGLRDKGKGDFRVIPICPLHGTLMRVVFDPHNIAHPFPGFLIAVIREVGIRDISVRLNVFRRVRRIFVANAVSKLLRNEIQVLVIPFPRLRNQLHRHEPAVLFAKVIELTAFCGNDAGVIPGRVVWVYAPFLVEVILQILCFLVPGRCLNGFAPCL